MGQSTDLFNAIWGRVKTDADMASRLGRGTMFPFTGEGVLRRLGITAAICPVLAMAPATGGHHWPPAKRTRGPASQLERRTAFLIEMATAGEDSRAILDLAEGFEDFMRRNLALDGFGLGSSFAEAEYSSQSYAPRMGMEKHVELWTFSGVMVCRFRIT